MSKTEFNEHDFCGSLLSLMDRIEVVNTSVEVAALLKQRFQIAEEHGLKIMFVGGDTSAEMH